MTKYNKLTLQKWPEPNSPTSFQHPGVVVDSGISCRQIYLRSYTFSRKESVNEKAKKYWARLRESVKTRRLFILSKDDEDDCSNNGGKKYWLWKGKGRIQSRDSLLLVLRRLMMSCSAKVDTADH